MTCPHCEELREEIRFLKRQVDVEVVASQIDRFMGAFGAPPASAMILSALYNAKGRVLSRTQLDEAAPATRVDPDQRDLKIIDVRISRLRKKLGEHAIQNVWGRGYYLTEIGRLQVEEALEAKAARAA